MPQMAPILWLPLFLLVTVALLCAQTCSYFNPLLQQSDEKVSCLPQTKYNWKW